MTMPRYCGIDLLSDESYLSAGGAFELTRPARESAEVAVDGWEVEVRQGSDVVVARGGNEVSCEDAYAGALSHAQKGLDLMSIRGSNNLVVRNFDTDFLVWWPEASGLVIRICALSSLQIDVPHATLAHRACQDFCVCEP